MRRSKDPYHTMPIIPSDYDPCVCGHDAAFHCKQFTNIGGHTNIFNAYLHCEWNDYHYGSAIYGQTFLDAGCKCNKFRQDNLTVLLRKHEKNNAV